MTDDLVERPDGPTGDPSVLDAAPRQAPLRGLLRKAAQFSAGSVVTTLASVARVGITARVLGSAEAGAWLGLQLLLSYAGNLHLGTLYGAFRSVPMLLARGDEKGARRERETSFAVVSIMAAVGLVSFVVLAPRVSTSATRLQVGLTGTLLVANLYRMYWATLARAESRFTELSVAWGFGACVTVPSLWLVPRWGLTGVIVGMLGQTVTETGYLAWRLGAPRPLLHLRVLTAQMRVGLVTLATTLGTIALTTADRALMLRLCGEEPAGHYYLGANIVTLVPMVALMPTGVLTPKFFERAAVGEDLLPLIAGPLKLMALFVAVLCGTAGAILPAVVARVWPNHLSGLAAAMVALIATCPVVLAGLTTNVFYALDRQGQHVVVLGLAAASAWGLGYLGVRLAEGGIVGAVGGCAVAMVGYYAAVTLLAMRLIPSQTRGGALRMTLGSFGPTLACAAALCVVSLVAPGWWRGEVPGAAFALGAVIVVSLPFVPGARRALRGA